MVRRLLTVASTIAMFAACGGSKSPGGPTPQYPNLVGGWNGTLTIAAVELSPPYRRASNICTESWIINTQNGGQFSGTFQESGGTFVPCASSGTLSGAVSASGQVSGLSFAVVVGATSCRRLLGDGIWAGILTGNSLVAQRTDRLQCPNETGDRSLSLSMHKQ